MATRYSSISDVDKTYEVHGGAGRTEEAGHLISQEEMADWRNSKVISRAANGRQYLRFAFVGVNLLLFAVSILALVSSRKEDPSLEMNYLLKQTSFYSPIFDRLEIPTEITRVNGSLFSGAKPSLHRQFPSAEVEAYWDDIEPIRPFPVTRAQLLKMDRDPEVTVRFHESLGLGSDAYMAHFDVFHQIHCLNALRKESFKDYAPYPTTTHIHQPKLKWIHLAHCVDMLMQNLMCQPNVDLITYNWVETQSIPVADFSINHQCRNWDTIATWQKENSIPPEEWVGMPKTDDVRWLPQEEEFYDVFGHDDHDHDQFVSLDKWSS